MADVYRAQFTTSASKQEENKERREAKGHYFGARVRTVTKGYEPPRK